VIVGAACIAAMHGGTLATSSMEWLSKACSLKRSKAANDPTIAARCQLSPVFIHRLMLIAPVLATSFVAAIRPLLIGGWNISWALVPDFKRMGSGKRHGRLFE
jgi:flagellar biosynthesis protein FlhB